MQWGERIYFQSARPILFAQDQFVSNREDIPKNFSLSVTFKITFRPHPKIHAWEHLLTTTEVTCHWGEIIHHEK